MNPLGDIGAVCFDWGGTLMVDDGPADQPMALWPQVAAIAGARDCLAALHGRLALAIATNAGASQRPMIEQALRRVDLLSYFSDIFCYTELGYRKHQLEFWQTVARRLRLPLNRIAMLGDSLQQDVLAPRQFGVQSVWFNHNGHQPPPAAPVPTITRLEQLVAMLGSAGATAQ